MQGAHRRRRPTHPRGGAAARPPPPVGRPAAAPPAARGRPGTRWRRRAAAPRRAPASAPRRATQWQGPGGAEGLPTPPGHLECGSPNVGLLMLPLPILGLSMLYIGYIISYLSYIMHIISYHISCISYISTAQLHSPWGGEVFG